MRIGNIDLNEEILVVAEIGNNHEGSYTLAEELIGLASEAGAKAVKFQTYVTEKFVSPLETQRIDQLKRFGLSYTQFEKLKRVADRENIIFLSTPLDVESAVFLDRLVPAFKISSADNDFFPMIECIANTGKPIIVSSGMTNLMEIGRTKEFILSVWEKNGVDADNLAVLHCVSSYPTDLYNANLSFINDLRRISSTVGYSDHTIGIEAALLSVAMGARIIEKHFTVDKKYSAFRDHSISSDPKELKELVQGIKHIEAIVGNRKKHLLDCESSVANAARRSISAKQDISIGKRIELNDITWLRPGGGLRVGEERKVIGKVATRKIKAGQQIRLDDLQETEKD
ncbi:MAG TPA: N-acetylneuraminate synthase family protein [Syntrophorhabdaceae bacterium]|nr:N-acetylneuraminate synthase family protein [Syntrophorhabdaceae bacterium]